MLVCVKVRALDYLGRFIRPTFATNLAAGSALPLLSALICGRFSSRILLCPTSPSVKLKNISFATIAGYQQEGVWHSADNVGGND